MSTVANDFLILTSVHTGLVGICEVRAKVEDHVQVTSFLEAAARLLKGVLGDLRQLAAAQREVVALVDTLHQLQDVPVVWWVLPHLWAVDVTLNLIGTHGRRGVRGSRFE